MKEKPNYYAIIPADVRYDTTLKDKAKLLYGEITSLSNEKGYCYASNKYFAELYNVSVTTISLLIKELVDKGYIESEIIYKEDTKEILNRHLRIVKEGYLRNLKEGYLRNLKENNKYINNTSINNNIYCPAKAEQQLPYKEIIDYLNIKLGTHYKHTTPKTRSLIKARFNEGYTLDDFKTVIDKKYIEWYKDKKMNVYLRPETLFSNKFEGYLNQRKRELTLNDIKDKIDLTDFWEE